MSAVATPANWAKVLYGEMAAAPLTGIRVPKSMWDRASEYLLGSAYKKKRRRRRGDRR